MTDELKDTILDNAGGPARASNDQGSFDAHSLPDQIAADKYLSQRSALATGVNPARRLRFVKIVPGSAD